MRRVRFDENMPRKLRPDLPEFSIRTAQFEIGVVVLETVETTLPNLRRVLPEIRKGIESVTPGSVVIVELP